MNINKVVLAGRITKDPVIKEFESGSKIITFSIATNRYYKSKDGEKKEESEFHNCVAWNKSAEFINKYFSKGDPIYIEGRLKTDSYEKEGVKKYSTKIIIDQIQFVGSKKRDKVKEDGEKPKEQTTAEMTDDMVDDIPF